MKFICTNLTGHHFDWTIRSSYIHYIEYRYLVWISVISCNLALKFSYCIGKSHTIGCTLQTTYSEALQLPHSFRNISISVKESMQSIYITQDKHTYSRIIGVEYTQLAAASPKMILQMMMSPKEKKRDQRIIVSIDFPMEWICTFHLSTVNLCRDQTLLPSTFNSCILSRKLLEALSLELQNPRLPTMSWKSLYRRSNNSAIYLLMLIGHQGVICLQSSISYL